MENKQLPFGFLTIWIFANTIGWGIFSLIRILQFWNFGTSISLGFIIGFFQWLVLRKYIRVDSSWIWVSTITYGILLTSLLLLPIETIFEISLTFFVILLFLGFLQRSVLEYYLYGSILWVISSAFAGFISIFFAALYIFENSILIKWAIFGLIYGVITGISISTLYKSTFDKKV